MINEPSPFSPCWYSHKFKGPGVRYEVALSINGGDIVHINGPFPCGSNPDITIFRKKLINKLDEGEFVEADRGYRGEPFKVRIPVDYETEHEKVQKELACARHETINARLKNFQVLSNRFRHGVTADDMGKHGMAFSAVAVVTQLSIENGERLFPVQFH